MIEARSGTGMTLNDSVYDRLLRERIIFLGQPVDDTIANQICAQLLLLSAEDDTRDIALYINSPGWLGHGRHGDLRHDAVHRLRRRRPTPSAWPRRWGSSCSRPARRGKRYALPHARILMHQPSAGIGGTASDIQIQAEQFKLTKVEMAELIAAHTGQTVEQIRLDSERDRWFTAQQALEYGFVDHVVAKVNQMPNGTGPAPA